MTNAIDSCCWSSPRTWGCFFFVGACFCQFTVFPTHVGVFLLCMAFTPRVRSLPHARGGVSPTRKTARIPMLSSPRTWGCFRRAGRQVMGLSVFPTHVGVFLVTPRTPSRPPSLPHARGGVSRVDYMLRIFGGSSPRTWGCFFVAQAHDLPEAVFPTHVGVFLSKEGSGAELKCLPHARGGVSPVRLQEAAPDASSPRTWGCFRLERIRDTTRKVFPTHVGVFPHPRFPMTRSTGLPHARGGVSIMGAGRGSYALSSPRTWGCFHKPNAPPTDLSVFPTHVGGQPLTKRDGWRGVSVPD